MTRTTSRPRLIGLVALVGLVIGTAACATSSDKAERGSLAALAVIPPPPAAPTTTQPAPRGCTPQSAQSTPSNLQPTSPLPKPGHMPPGGYLATIQHNKRLIVGVDQNTLQLSYFDPQSDRMTGFEPDLLREIAGAIFGDQTRIEFRAVTSSQRANAIKTDQVDIVADAMTMTCARLNDVAFSSMYYRAEQEVLVDKNSPIHSIGDLTGKRVCATAGSTTIAKLESIPGVIAVGKPARTDCLVALQEGTVDAISADSTILVGFHAQDPTTTIVKGRGSMLESEPYGMAISKNADHQDFIRFVNGVLLQLQQNGTLKQLENRYGLPVTAPAASP